MTTRPTFEQLHRLGHIAQRLRQGAVNVRKARAVFDNASAALIAECIDSGLLLNEARAILGAAQFKEWLSEKLPAIPAGDVTAWAHCAKNAQNPPGKALRALGVFSDELGHTNTPKNVPAMV